MNFKQINEDIISLVERTIDPKFRDALQASRDKQAVGLQREVDYNKQRAAQSTDPEYYEKEAKQYTDKLAGKKSADFVYNELYHKGLAVDQATIEYIGNGKDLDAKKLKNILKAKLPANKEYDRNNDVYLIADTHEPESLKYGSPERARSGFVVWVASYVDGVFNLDSWARTKAIEPYEKGRVLMADLNKGICNYDFYICYGPTVGEKQRQRRDAKDGVINRRKKSDLPSYDQDWYDKIYDKSGYDLEEARKKLMQRLQDYKKNNGKYTAKVEEVEGLMKEAETKVRDYMSKLDIGDYVASKKLNEILGGYRSFIMDGKWFIDEINSKDATDASVDRRYGDAIAAYQKLINAIK